MKKILLVLIMLLGISSAANAQFAGYEFGGKFQAERDIPSVDIKKGDVVYISFSKDYRTISFENTRTFNSFIAKNNGGMGGSKDGYYFRFYNIESYGIRVQIGYNSYAVRIGNTVLRKL
ncbi:MAG: hypothetical protein IKL20_06110 [Alistipes sp.]|nr:hypothetical protein [Alistipes sp.]